MLSTCEIHASDPVFCMILLTVAFAWQVDQRGLGGIPYWQSPDVPDRECV